MSAGFAEAFAEIFARPEDRVGPRIRAWRRRRNGMSQQVLADLVGVTQGYISAIEAVSVHWIVGRLRPSAARTEHHALSRCARYRAIRTRTIPES
jgi:predicted transcriptional regulator